MTRPAIRAALIGWLTITITASAGCTVHTRNLCEADGMEHIGVGVPRDCHACTDDADCIYQGNVCEGVVFCAHRDAQVVSTDIGCEPEPNAPSDSGCVCRDRYCQVR